MSPYVSYITLCCTLCSVLCHVPLGSVPLQYYATLCCVADASMCVVRRDIRLHHRGSNGALHPPAIFQLFALHYNVFHPLHVALWASCWPLEVLQFWGRVRSPGQYLIDAGAVHWALGPLAASLLSLLSPWGPQFQNLTHCLSV